MDYQFRRLNEWDGNLIPKIVSILVLMDYQFRQPIVLEYGQLRSCFHPCFNGLSI